MKTIVKFLQELNANEITLYEWLAKSLLVRLYIVVL